MNTNGEPFAAILQFLYGEEKAASALPCLKDIIARFEPVLKKAGAAVSGADAVRTPPFTHKDAFLISYGNMLSGGEDVGAAEWESGLARLYRFLEKRGAPASQSGGAGSFSYLHILPFHPYSSDDGFSVIDYRKVDPRFGSWDDLEKLSTLETAPSGGGNDCTVKPVFDLVINHGSVQSEWFRAFLAGDKNYVDWYITRNADYDYRAVVRPRTHPLLTPFARKTAAGEETVYAWTTFSADQVDYDFSNPGVLLEFVTILLEYAGRGAGIVRLDAIAYLWKEDGSSCLHHPKTHAVVKLFRAVIDHLGLPLLLLTETNVPHAENVSYFGKDVGDPAVDALPEAHIVYNFALPPLCLHAAVSGDAGPLRAWAKTLPETPGAQAGGTRPARQYFLNFLASHDGVGLTPAGGLVDGAAFAATLEEAKRRGALVSYKSTPAGDIPYELNCSLASVVAPPDSDWARAAFESGGPEAAAKLRARAFLAVHGVQLSLSGLPAVYFHSWIGSEAWAEGPSLLGYNRAINREKPDIGRVERELDDPRSFRFHVYRGMQNMLAFRKNEKAFSPEWRQTVLETDGAPPAVFALLRTPSASIYKGGILCLINLGAELVEWNAPDGAGLPRDCEKIRLDPWETLWTGFYRDTDGRKRNGRIRSRFSTV